MLLSNLLKESLDTATLECWELERTENALTDVAVRLHAIGYSLRETQETQAFLALLGVKRSHQAIFQWAIEYLTACPTHHRHRQRGSQWRKPLSRLTANGLDIRCNRHRKKLLLGIELFARHGTDSAVAFLSGLTEKHDLLYTVFLVDGYGYRTALFRIGLSDRLDYTEKIDEQSVKRLVVT